MGEYIASTEWAITDLYGNNVRHEEVMSATQTKRVVVFGPATTATEMGTHEYVLHSFLGRVSPVVEAILFLVDWIDRNQMELVCLMAEQETTTWFAYDVSWIVLAYFIACIFVSTVAA